MGCGSSGQVIPSPDEADNIRKASNGKSLVNGHHDNDGLPTVLLPDTPVKPKPPIAFEIPLEEFEGNRGASATPPPHVQRLLQPPAAEIRLPDIEEKLAVAEHRRQSILHQRMTSAQKRIQRTGKSSYDTDKLESNQNLENSNKHGVKTLTIPQAPVSCEDKNI